MEKFTEIDGKAPIVVPEAPKAEYATAIQALGTLAYLPPLFRTHKHGDRDWIVPKEDVEAVKVVFDAPKDLEAAYRYVKDWRVAVQAGGCIGTWSRAMAARFTTVYTFEPDPVNFACLSVNLADCLNVVKIQAALGDGCLKYGADLVRDPSNAGAHWIDDETDGPIPVVRIEDIVPPLPEMEDGIEVLGSPRIGLVQLDLEGYELWALHGMDDILTKGGDRPVFMIEEKGLGTRFQVQPDSIARYLARFGYKEVDRVNRDVIYAAT